VPTARAQLDAENFRSRSVMGEGKQARDAAAKGVSATWATHLQDLGVIRQRKRRRRLPGWWPWLRTPRHHQRKNRCVRPGRPEPHPPTPAQLLISEWWSVSFVDVDIPPCLGWCIQHHPAK
jgi:hypothetical protein